jgi:hypothetical protein
LKPKYCTEGEREEGKEKKGDREGERNTCVSNLPDTLASSSLPL